MGDDGPTGVDDPARRPLVQLDGGEIGYCCMPGRIDDCLRPAIATCLQVPIEQVPDPRLDARVRAGDNPHEVTRSAWEELEAWLLERGLRLVIHDQLPVNRARWVGVAELPSTRAARQALADFWRAAGEPERNEPTGDHCLVLGYDTIIFDPGISLPAPPGFRLKLWDPSEIVYGISFDRED